jgi:hypothetical protein
MVLCEPLVKISVSHGTCRKNEVHAFAMAPCIFTFSRSAFALARAQICLKAITFPLDNCKLVPGQSRHFRTEGMHISHFHGLLFSDFYLILSFSSMTCRCCIVFSCCLQSSFFILSFAFQHARFVCAKFPCRPNTSTTLLICLLALKVAHWRCRLDGVHMFKHGALAYAKR